MELINYFEEKKKPMINFLEELVHLESPSHDKEAVDNCSYYFLKQLKKLGVKVLNIKQDKVGDFVIIEYPGIKNENILILIHLDTVWEKGKIKQMPFRVEKDKIFGPGVLDMKAGAVMVYYSFLALKDLNLKPQNNILVFCNSEEEIGSRYAEKHIIDFAKNSKYVLCLEPSLPNGALKMQRKGRMVVKFSAHGKSAHGSAPEKGVNAILELSHQLLQLKKIQKSGITINVGLIKGGLKPNVVPDNAEAVLDIRFWKTQDKEKIISFFRNLKPKLSQAKLNFEVMSCRPPMEKTKASMSLFYRIKRVGKRLGIEINPGKSGGGSDASFASNVGIPTADGLGPIGNGIHSENEHLLVHSLIQRTALLTQLFLDL